MVKKRGNTSSSTKNNFKQNGKKNGKSHPIFRQKLTLGQRASDGISRFGGSWTFIIIFGVFLVAWIGINSFFLLRRPFDPFPYILLNLALSCLAAIQAPIILMAQNRQAERDRIDAKYNYGVNRKAEREIQVLQRQLLNFKKKVNEK